MSDRSELMKRILHTYDFSDEGRNYLDWLLEPGTEKLDGGAILRESVLDLIENDKQLEKLRQKKRTAGLEDFLSNLPAQKRSKIEEATNRLIASLTLQKEAIRQQARSLRGIRRILKLDRIEALKLVSQLAEAHPSDEISTFLKNFQITEEVSSKVAALRRTRAEVIDIEAEWKAHSNETPWTDAIKNIADNPGEDSDNHREKFDRFYAQQAVTRLDGTVERLAKLMPVNIEVKNQHVAQLFQEAHDVFLFGFDAASIALCRSLVEHALRDKLHLSHGNRATLQSMVRQAKEAHLLNDEDCVGANLVRAAGDKIMHDLPNLESTAHQVLDNTRAILNNLYGERQHKTDRKQ